MAVVNSGASGPRCRRPAGHKAPVASPTGGQAFKKRWFSEQEARQRFFDRLKTIRLFKNASIFLSQEIVNKSALVSAPSLTHGKLNICITP